MFESVLGIIRFAFTLVFGMAVSVLFAGIEGTRKNRITVGILCVIFFLAQSSCLWLLGHSWMARLYPLFVHLPLILVFIFYYKRPPLISVISVFSAYMCCTIPYWAQATAEALFESKFVDVAVYIASVFPTFYFLRRFVGRSLLQLMEKSVKSCVSLGAMPLFYYLFDYITGVYTDILYSGTKWAANLMPSAVIVFFFVFIIIYYAETQKQARLQREHDMLDMQFRQAQTEFASMRQIQENTAVYRHDMRHHLAVIKGLASNEVKLREYLRTAESDMDAITPVRFCNNETVNLILSAYAGKAKQAEVTLTVEVKLPSDLSPHELPFSDTELCSLLSNALENALHACKLIPESEKRSINLRIYSRNNKFYIDITNNYQTEPVFENDLPVTKEAGHGFGTKSMAHIVEKHGGMFKFSVEDGLFVFQGIV